MNRWSSSASQSLNKKRRLCFSLSVQNKWARSSRLHCFERRPAVWLALSLASPNTRILATCLACPSKRRPRNLPPSERKGDAARGVECGSASCQRPVSLDGVSHFAPLTLKFTITSKSERAARLLACPPAVATKRRSVSIEKWNRHHWLPLFASPLAVIVGRSELPAGWPLWRHRGKPAHLGEKVPILFSSFLFLLLGCR